MQSLCRSFLDRHGEISLFNESFCFMSISVYLCLSLSADTTAQLSRNHVVRMQVNLNDGASRRNVVLKENGEFWVFGEKRWVWV